MPSSPTDNGLHGRAHFVVLLKTIGQRELDPSLTQGLLLVVDRLELPHDILRDIEQLPILMMAFSSSS